MNDNNWGDPVSNVPEEAEYDKIVMIPDEENQVEDTEAVSDKAEAAAATEVSPADEAPVPEAEPAAEVKAEEIPAYRPPVQNMNNQNVNPYSYGNQSYRGNGNAYPYSQQSAPGGYNNSNQYPYGNNGSYPYGNGTPGGNYGNYNNGYPYSRPQNGGYAYPAGGSGDNNKKSKGTKIFGIVAGVLALFMVIALISVVIGDDSTPVKTPDETTSGSINVEEFATNASPVTGDTSTSDGELTPKNIFKKVLPSSVGILVYDKSKTLASEGSGVLFQESTDGKYTFIVTCAHVISDSTGYIRVRLHNGKEYDAQVVGFDARTDIGVIRVEETGFTLAEIGDSSKIEVGDYVYAIGNPGGVEFADSFTNGMVSALDRPVSSSSTGYTTECIQHTAAINPGNSGGALVNSFGQVIGINSMKIVDDEYEGMGFAVPSSVFVDIVNEIMKHGYVSNRPKLGITYVPASEYSSYGMFVAIKGLPSGSIVIYEIASDSALAGTKAQAGDMIVAVNGTPLQDASYLSELIEESNVGDALTLSIVRINNDYSSEEFEVTVKLVEDRGDTFVQEEETTASQMPGGNYGGSYGGNYGGGYGGSYEDYFNQYFEEFFNGMR